MSNTEYIKQPRGERRRVFFTGSTALYKGMGVCYDHDYTGTATGTTATDPAAERDWRVELPATTNNRWFAGVAAMDYAAKSGGQYIDIYLPGSTCELAVITACTVASTRLALVHGGPAAGFWYKGVFQGAGTALALETTDTASATIATGVILESMDGTASFATTEIVTVSSSANMALGDHVIVFNANAAADGTEAITAGIYDITALPASTTFTIGTATVSAASVGNLIVLRGYPTVLAKLDTGLPSGGCAIVGLAAGGAFVPVPTGFNYLLGGGVTMAAAATYTLVAPTQWGSFLGFKVLGEIGGSTYLVDITAAGFQDDFATALVSLICGTTSANNEYHLLYTGVWRGVYNSGWTESAS